MFTIIFEKNFFYFFIIINVNVNTVYLTKLREYLNDIIEENLRKFKNKSKFKKCIIKVQF